MRPVKNAKPSYAQLRGWHEYLWREYGPAGDMAGGYDDYRDLAKLMRSPTRRTAEECYRNQIEWWFERGPENPDVVEDIPWDDPKVLEIAKALDIEAKGAAENNYPHVFMHPD